MQRDLWIDVAREWGRAEKDERPMRAGRGKETARTGKERRLEGVALWPPPSQQQQEPEEAGETGNVCSDSPPQPRHMRARTRTHTCT